MNNADDLSASSFTVSPAPLNKAGALVGSISSSHDLDKLSTEELRQRIARLEAENQDLRIFSARIAHEVRAPIRAIDGMSAMILADQENTLDLSSIRYLKLIRCSTTRLGHTVDDLLTLAKLSQQLLRSESVNLSKLAETIASVLFHANPQRDVRLTVAPYMQTVGDPGLLRMALSNLIGNAWKFSRNVAVAEIEIGRQAIEGREVFFVRDNGAGFNMDHAKKLFEPFTRLHRQEEFDGTGIGLSLVKKIVERHGGKVWAQGLEGKGATFFFSVGTDR